MRHTRCRIKPLALLVFAAVSGCASTAPRPAPVDLAPAISDLVASEALGFWLGGEGPVPVKFRIIEGTDAGKLWSVEAVGPVRDEAEVLTGFSLHWTVEGEKLPRSERDMVVGPEGDLSMARVVQRDRSVITVFDPPVLLMPARINPGATVRQDVKVTVLELANPKKTKERGTGALEARFDGQQTLPDGRSVLVYTTVLDLKLSAARSRRETVRWFSPVGEFRLVRERFEETIRVLGVIIESTEQTLEPVEGDGSAVAPSEAPRENG